jgi:hypothetical protein
LVSRIPVDLTPDSTVEIRAWKGVENTSRTELLGRATVALNASESRAILTKVSSGKLVGAWIDVRDQI